MIDALMRDAQTVQYLIQAIVILFAGIGAVVIILAALVVNSAARTDDQPHPHKEAGSR